MNTRAGSNANESMEISFVENWCRRKPSCVSLLLALLWPAVAAAQNTSVTGERIRSTLCEESAGSASPEGVVTGTVCDRYVWIDSTGVILYVKRSGVGTTTGWVAQTSASSLTTWVGSRNITTLGTITTGVWQGAAIADTYLAALSATKLTGTLAATQFPELTGDISTTAGSLATTAAGTQPNIGSIPNLTTVGTITTGTWNAGDVTSSDRIQANRFVVPDRGIDYRLQFPDGYLYNPSSNVIALSDGASDKFTIDVSSGTVTSGVWNGGAVTSSGPITAAAPHHAFGTIDARDNIGIRVTNTFTSDGGPNHFIAGIDLDPTLTATHGATNYQTYLNVAGFGIITQPAETVALVSSVRIAEPQLTVGADGTVTTAASLYIHDAPTGGVTNHALHVAGGPSYFGGLVEMESGLRLGYEDEFTLGTTAGHRFNIYKARAGSLLTYFDSVDDEATSRIKFRMRTGGTPIEVVTLAPTGVEVAGTFSTRGADGGYWERGANSELISLSTSGTTTDSSADLLPADAVIEAVTARITASIAMATDWSLGDSTTAARFAAANSALADGTTSVGLAHVDQSGASGPRQTSAAKLRITTTGTPSAGAIRVTVYYRRFVAPTS